jgi:hypothetical protein
MGIGDTVSWGALNAITMELVTATTDAYINAISVIELLMMDEGVDPNVHRKRVTS